MHRIRLKKNDMVFVRKGKLMIKPETGRVIVEKINYVKEFIRPDRSKNVQGGIMGKEAPVAVSNLMLYCGDCEQGARVRIKTLEDGTRIRVCVKCGSSLERT
jgi:large subunit ribosomal protein L24